MIGGTPGVDHVYSSANAGLTWVDRGVAPAGVTDLEPTGGHAGFAAGTVGTTGKGAVLWAVSGDGALFSPVELPRWVKTTGNSSMAMPMN
jgi:hypothetical protein